MEISEKYYYQDQATKEKVNMKVDEALALGGKLGSEVESEYKPA